MIHWLMETSWKIEASCGENIKEISSNANKELSNGYDMYLM